MPGGTLITKPAVGLGGAGVRYEWAYRYSMHIGIDVACGSDGTALHVQWGSARARP
jgi:hypothetical protein